VISRRYLLSPSRSQHVIKHMVVKSLRAYHVLRLTVAVMTRFICCAVAEGPSVAATSGAVVDSADDSTPESDAGT
jgi:hypothetical protein